MCAISHLVNVRQPRPFGARSRSGKQKTPPACPMATKAGSAFCLDTQTAELTVPDRSRDSAGDIKGVHGIEEMSVSGRTVPSCQSTWDVPVLCYGGPSKTPLYHEDSIICQNGVTHDAIYDAFWGSIPTTTHTKPARKARSRSKSSGKTTKSRTKRSRSARDATLPTGATHAQANGSFPEALKTTAAELNNMMECAVAGARQVDNACDIRTLTSSGVQISTDLDQNVACSLDTMSYVYLRQEAVYRIMNLDRLIFSHGWNLGMMGTQILSGAVVLVARADGWRLRRIKSWCPDTMKIMLEDGLEVTPFDLCNGVLEGARVHLDFAIKEYNHQIHKGKLKGFLGQEVLATFYRLMLCSKAGKKLPSSQDQPKLISNLVQKLLSGPPARFIDEFSPHLDELDLGSEKSHACSYDRTMDRMGERIQGLFCNWLSNSCHIDTDPSPEIDIENDLKLYSNAIRRFRFDSRLDANLRSDGEESDIMFGSIPQPCEDRVQRGAEHSGGVRYISPLPPRANREDSSPGLSADGCLDSEGLINKRRGYVKSKFVGGHLIEKNSTGGTGGGHDLGVRMLRPKMSISDVRGAHGKKPIKGTMSRDRIGSLDSRVKSLG